MYHAKEIVLLTAILGLVATGWSEEVPDMASKDFSIRASLGTAPGLSESDYGVVKIDMDENTGGQLEILAVQRYWSKNRPSIGGVFGGGIFFASNSGEEETTIFDPWEFDVGAFGLVGQAGIAGKIGENVVVEVLPYLGVGGAVTEVTTSAGASDDGSGSYFMYGIKGGVFVQLTQSIDLGVEIGYQGVSVDVEVDGAPDIELSGAGVRGAAVLAIKF